MTKRRYNSRQRKQAAAARSARVLDAALSLFGRRGIDDVTIEEIASAAGVSVPTVYARYQSKAGILRALARSAVFGARYQAAQARLEGESDAARLIALTASVARSIYEGESEALGQLQRASAFSPALRQAERELEDLRLEMQEARVSLLFSQSKARKGLTFDRARQLLWMYTSRDIYRMLVHQSGWTPGEYEAWLSDTLVSSLVEPVVRSRSR